ncbi:MAG: saccharopine dehydrogenase [Flavobacteriaceae bacterium]|nr:saccharopine dehydrogenase NADP-binding domain-containing protein [Bacteroidia bacterium]NNK87214.1 saccharopine dehydrogenase [Flavobacteriaceae bacterium]
MKQIIVLGAGMVGSAMALDLAKTHSVCLCDADNNRLKTFENKYPNLKIRHLDVTDTTQLKTVISPFDIVLSAVPGFLGFSTLKTIIEAGKDVVDISFFAENALDLKPLAEKNNITAVVDCGVAPGMGNIILGRYNELLKLTHFECLVGGLPKVKTWPFCYKAPFSPVDVIEEYTRPARYVEQGQIITREPLSDCEYVEFEKVGTLESFNTDGLRSILYTMSHIPNMKEKTLRYPGHVEYIKVLKASGFFDDAPVELKGKRVTPLEMSSKLLFNAWKLNPEDEELTVMRVTLRGKDHNGNDQEVIYDLYDEYCKKTKTSSMSRTTGYTATAMVNLILDGQFNAKGLFPPEQIGKYESCFDFIMSYLEEREVIYEKRYTTIN